MHFVKHRRDTNCRDRIVERVVIKHSANDVSWSTRLMNRLENAFVRRNRKDGTILTHDVCSTWLFFKKQWEQTKII